MKKFKKLVSLVLAGTMALAMSISTFAATAGITADEQRILDQAEAKAVELGVSNTQTYKDYVSQATTYLAKNELNAEQVNAMVKAVDEAAATAQAEMKAKGVSTLLELSKEDITALFSKVEGEVTKAAAAVGIVIVKTNDGFEVKDLPKEDSKNPQNPDSDKKSDTYLQTTTVIKQTGTDLAADKVGASVSVDTAATDMTTTVILGVMFVGAVAVCGVVAKRKNLFSGVEA
ncbi:MAG: hypothetical protein HFI75_02465 [Lachnospiraceae bacterium]|nr:hypothetical protein [Lachnospiraceae bacterium]